jgi:hypothetical protein
LLGSTGQLSTIIHQPGYLLPGKLRQLHQSVLDELNFLSLGKNRRPARPWFAQANRKTLKTSMLRHEFFVNHWFFLAGSETHHFFAG